MLTLSCPSCGANVDFQSKSSVFAVCSFCKSSLVRQDLNLDSIGKIADLQDDLTAFQIGTTGMFNKEKFEIIGRLKVGYSDGFWNEWYTTFGDERVAWLAEAQGFLAFCYPYEVTDLPEVKTLKIGQAVDLKEKGIYEIDDIRAVKCLYSEGELPFDAVQGRKSTSVDLTGFELEMATIEYAAKETRTFIGHYLDFDDFQFKNLRPIDGW